MIACKTFLSNFYILPLYSPSLYLTNTFLEISTLTFFFKIFSFHFISMFICFFIRLKENYIWVLNRNMFVCSIFNFLTCFCISILSPINLSIFNFIFKSTYPHRFAISGFASISLIV